MENRLKKKLNKANSKTASLQEAANKQFNKANQQRNSMWQFRRNKADSSFEKGYQLQEKRERVEYKMSKQYERYLNKFLDLDLTMDSDLRAQGLDYYNRVLANTDTQYKAALMKRVS